MLICSLDSLEYLEKSNLSSDLPPDLYPSIFPWPLVLSFNCGSLLNLKVPVQNPLIVVQLLVVEVHVQHILYLSLTTHLRRDNTPIDMQHLQKPSPHTFARTLSLSLSHTLSPSLPLSLSFSLSRTH